MSASTCRQDLPEPEWLPLDEYLAIHETRRCPDCWKRMLFGYCERLVPLPLSGRTFLFFTNFRNVRIDGTVKDGGLALYFCPHCRVEYAYGPRTEDGRYRLLRLP